VARANADAQSADVKLCTADDRRPLVGRRGLKAVVQTAKISAAPPEERDAMQKATLGKLRNTHREAFTRPR